MSLRLVSRIPLSRTSSLRPECVSSDKLYLRCSTPPLHNLFRSKAVASGHNLSGGRPAPWLSLPPRIHQSSKASGWLHQRQAMTSGVAADSGDAWAEGRAVDARSGAAGASGSISRPAGDSPPVSVSEDEGPSDAQQMSPAAGGDRVPGGSIAPKSAAQLGFRITGEEERYSRWLTLYDRTIRFPPHGSHPEQEHAFDIIGHPRAAFSFVVVFPFHPRPDGAPGGEVTLLREYSQGVNEMMYVLPTGAFDPRRHACAVAAGQAELSEEARLQGGQWTSLLADGHPGVPEVKWCRNRMLPFLCVGPTVDPTPGAREPEEFIEVSRVSIPDLRRLMRSGEMMLPSVSTCAFALDELRERGMID